MFVLLLDGILRNEFRGVGRAGWAVFRPSRSTQACYSSSNGIVRIAASTHFTCDAGGNLSSRRCGRRLFSGKC